MKRLIQLFIFVLCVGFFGLRINAQTSPNQTKKNSDARVENALNDGKTPYELDKDGTYKVTLETPGKRHQNAFIGSDIGDLYGTKSREIFSYAMIGDSQPSQEIANLLLEQNMANPSTWAVIRLPEGKFAIVNFIWVRADADTAMLYGALITVTEAADKMEQKLTKKDEL